MYRVELKEKLKKELTEFKHVPNVPCGVERHQAKLKQATQTSCVPNVPCGVESAALLAKVSHDLHGFLMYRVELKACLQPCLAPLKLCSKFLMYRVELKVACVKLKHHQITRFLMYRVELKDTISAPSFEKWFSCS